MQQLMPLAPHMIWTVGAHLVMWTWLRSRWRVRAFVMRTLQFITPRATWCRSSRLTVTPMVGVPVSVI